MTPPLASQRDLTSVELNSGPSMQVRAGVPSKHPTGWCRLNRHQVGSPPPDHVLVTGERITWLRLIHAGARGDPRATATATPSAQHLRDQGDPHVSLWQTRSTVQWANRSATIPLRGPLPRVVLEAWNKAHPERPVPMPRRSNFVLDPKVAAEYGQRGSLKGNYSHRRTYRQGASKADDASES